MLEKTGRPLALDAQEAAAAIVRIANDKMAGAIRMVSLARGHDPRDFVLFPFGGAGPLHAAALAKELGIPVSEEDLQPYDLYTADEAFFTSTSPCVLPVTKVDRRPIGDGKPGPTVQRLLQAWSETVEIGKWRSAYT